MARRTAVACQVSTVDSSFLFFCKLLILVASSSSVKYATCQTQHAKGCNSISKTMSSSRFTTSTFVARVSLIAWTAIGRSVADKGWLIGDWLSWSKGFMLVMLAVRKRLGWRIPILRQGLIERDRPSKRQSTFIRSIRVDCRSSSKRRTVLSNITVSIFVSPIKKSCDQSGCSNWGGDPQQPIFPYTVSSIVSAVIRVLFVLNVRTRVPSMPNNFGATTRTNARCANRFDPTSRASTPESISECVQAYAGYRAFD